MSHFVPGGLEIGMKRIEGGHGHFGAPALHFGLRPASVEANGAGDVLRKSMTEIAFAEEDVANEASGSHVEDAAGSLARGIVEAQKNFASIGIFLTVVPGLRRVNFGMMAARALVFRFESLHLVGGIEVQNTLAGITDHGLLAGADIVVNLRAQHDLAGHAFVLAHFGDAAAAEF